MPKEQCVFCSIIKGEIPAKIIDENEKTLAFHDINPAADLHALIIPKIHFANINEVNEENASYIGHMMMMAKNIAASFNVAKSGYRIVFNNEKGASQTVFHIHAHLLGGRKFSWPPG